MKTSFLVVGTRGAFLFAIATALIVGAVWPVAAQMKKEGTYSGTYSSFGTCKSTPIGKERLLLVCDENGLSLSDGFADHITWHCWGMADFANGMGAPHGSCVGTDPAGDQISLDFVHEPHTPDAKNISGSFTYTAGTGKFAGLSGKATYAGDNQFRTAVEGTYAFHNHFQGSYKLP